MEEIDWTETFCIYILYDRFEAHIPTNHVIYRQMAREDIDSSQKDRIRCMVRRRMFIGSPEELVRQRVLHYLVEQLGYPLGRFSVENTIEVNGMMRRTDILLHNEYGAPLMIVECKAPGISLDQRTLSQISSYNLALGAKYLLLTNGDENHILHIDSSKRTVETMDRIPSFEEL